MNSAKDDLTPEMEALKAKLKATWMSGDFDKIAQIYAPGAEEFVERLALRQGELVLDVACGTGNLSFPASRAGARVVGLDIAPNLLEAARARAQTEGMEIRFDEGDAEQLPYEDAAFDTVITMFGAMFAARPEKVAAELTRVSSPGGRIAMANWTPTGFIGQMFKTTSAHVPPPPGMQSPVRWGDEEVVRERLSDGITSLELTRRLISFKFLLAVPDVIEFWRAWYGPTQRAFAALDENGQQALRRDLERLWSENNRATDGTTHVDSEYLEIVAVCG
jgi:SAM-dependent methyltransferase